MKRKGGKTITPHKLLQKTAAALELPPEVALDTVKLCLIGNNELRAINHRGILVYERERIVFRCSQGLVSVIGRELKLAELNDERLRILGCISSLRLPGSGKAGAAEAADITKADAAIAAVDDIDDIDADAADAAGAADAADGGADGGGR